MSAACVLFLPLLRLLIIRAASAPAVPAAAAAARPQRSAFDVASRPERCCEPEPRRAAPYRTRVSFTLFSLGKWSERSLDATTTSTGTVWWPRSSDMCILGADMTASPRASRPAASPASGPRMTSFVQNSFLTGLEAPRECQHTGRATQAGNLEVMAEWVGSAFARCQKKASWRLTEVKRARAAAKGTVGGCGGQRRPWGGYGGVPDCGVG